MVRFLYSYLLFVFTLPLSSNAQMYNFLPGFIVSSNNDTLTGDINIDNGPNKYNRCIFRDNKTKEILIYNPNQLKAYGIYDYKLLESKTIPYGSSKKTIFLEKLFHGNIDIYYIKDDSINENYILEKNGTFNFLTYDDSDKPKYRRVLKYVMYDADGLHEMIDRTTFDHKSIIHIAKDYHTYITKNKNFIIINNKIDRDQPPLSKKSQKTPPSTNEEPVSTIHKEVAFDFLPGYIVSLTNDTIYGWIDYSETCNNSYFCYFKMNPSDKITTYNSGQIKSYAIPNFKYYISKTIAINNRTDSLSTLFLEFLADGIIDLYYNCEGNYYVEKNGIIYELSNDETTYYDGQLKYSTNSNKYKSTLQYLTKDAISLKEQIDNTEFTHKSLSRIIRKYHNLSNVNINYVDFYNKTEEKNKIKWRFTGGVALGVNISSINVNTTCQTTPVNVINNNGTFYSSLAAFVPALFLNLNSNRRIFFQLEFRYQNLNYPEVQFSEINLPLLINYQLFKNKNPNAFASFGITPTFDFNSSLNNVNVEYQLYNLTYKNDISYNYFNQTNLNFYLGAGAKYDFKNKNGLKLEVRWSLPNMTSRPAIYFFSNVVEFETDISYSNFLIQTSYYF